MDWDLVVLLLRQFTHFLPDGDALRIALSNEAILLPHIQTPFVRPKMDDITDSEGEDEEDEEGEEGEEVGDEDEEEMEENEEDEG